ncbi:MAG: DUF115 domain-containing protein [Simkaniaceae bacterium]|nr:DUF115 domain-containing protein [Simkaniaceae bacterium]
MNHAEVEAKNPRLAFEILRVPPKKHQKSFGPIFSDAKVLVLHGINFEESHFFHWLEEAKDRALIVLDDDLGCIAQFAQLESSKIFLEHPRFHICFTEHVESLKEILWKHVLLPLEHFALDRQAKGYKKFQEFHAAIHCVASEYSDFGVQVMHNLYANIKCMDRPFEMPSKALNVPAVICGAGPSLERCIPQLKKLENKVIIFGGGSAMPLLSNRGINFHVGASFDPKPPLERFLAHSQFEAPIFLQNRLSHDLYFRIHGQRLSLGDNGAYPIESWIYEKLGMPRPCFDGGWTVADFMTKIALLLGCNPIIFAGVDLEDDKPDFKMSSNFLRDLKRLYPGRTFKNGVFEGLDAEYDIHGMLQLALRLGRGPYAKKEHLSSIFQEIVDSLEAVKRKTEMIISASNAGLKALFEIEMEEEIAFKNLLSPIWQIWKPILARDWQKDPKLLAPLFFQDIANKHLKVINEYL